MPSDRRDDPDAIPGATPHVEYHRDGSVRATGRMLDGVPVGRWEWLRLDGTRLRSGTFDAAGEQVGEWTTYDRAGEPYKVTRMRARPPGSRPARAPALSPRLAAIVDALPLRAGLRVLEIGCGPGAAAREVARRIGDGHVLAIDRSAAAVRQAAAASADEIAAGRLSVRRVAAEDLVLEPGERPYDLAFAVRVGALDGRHPEAGRRALRRIAAALAPGGRLLVDGGDPLREIPLDGVARR